MFAVDFEYDGQYLSDYGFIICSFDGASDTVSAGSKITFNTVPIGRGKRYSLTSTQYDECIQTTFSITKNPCINNDIVMTDDEYRDLSRWLNRDGFYRFQILDEEPGHEVCFYDASFNIEKKLINGMLCGLILTMETNRPFGYGEEKQFVYDINDTTKQFVLYDTSDDIGFIYPYMEITCKTTCQDNEKLIISNESENCSMEIGKCTVGEIITMYGDTQILMSSTRGKDIYDDFNFEFFKIGNTFQSRKNIITTSLPCVLDIRYSPIIKNTPD